MDESIMDQSTDQCNLYQMYCTGYSTIDNDLDTDIGRSTDPLVVYITVSLQPQTS